MRLELAQVEDELVRAASMFAGVEDRIVRRQLLRHVVGVQDRGLGGELQTIGAHHGDVRPRDGEDRSAPKRGRGNRTGRGLRLERMAGQERNEMGSHADRSHARTAAAVRNAERLVQVDVADVGPHVGGPGEADLRVHVGPVHVDLPAALVHDLADSLHLLLEDAVGRRVGDHQGGQAVLVLVRLLLEIGEVHVALLVAGDHHDLEADHDRGGGVGAVSGDGNEADIAVAFSRGVIPADREQPRVLALGARVRLQGNPGEAGDLGQPVGQFPGEGLVALGLVLRARRDARSRSRAG